MEPAVQSAEREPGVEHPCWPGWEDGDRVAMDVRVEIQHTKDDGDRAQRHVYAMEGDVTLDVERRGHEWVLRQEFSGWRGENMAPAIFGSEYIRHRIPVLVIGPDGRLAAIEGGDEARARAREDVRAAEGTPFGSPEIWRQATSDRGLRLKAAEWWSDLARVSCAELPPNGRVEFDNVAHVGGITLPTRNVLRELGTAPCGEGTCERRVHEVVVDPEAMCSAMQRQLPAQVRAVGCSQATHEEALRDVGTHRPRSVRLERATTHELVRGDDRLRQEIQTVTTYDLEHASD